MTAGVACANSGQTQHARPPRRQNYPEPVDLRLVWPALTMWAVIIWALEQPVSTSCLSLAGVAALFGGFWGWTRRRAECTWRGLAVLCFCAALAGLAASASHVYLLQHSVLYQGASQERHMQVKAQVFTDPVLAPTAFNDQNYRVTLRMLSAAGHPVGRVVTDVKVSGVGWQKVRMGSTVAVAIKLQKPRSQAAPLWAYNNAPPTVLSPPSGTLALVEKIRSGLRQACQDLPPATRGLLPGIAIGDQSNLDGQLEEDLRTTSLTHLAVVSGAHVSLLVALVLVLAAVLPRPARLVVASLVLVALVILVRPAESILRAAVMGLVGLLGVLLGRPGVPLPALSVAVMGLLAWEPGFGRSYGFALSVAATFGIVTLGRAWASSWASKLPKILAEPLAITVAAQCACLPILLLWQPFLPTYGIVANFAAAPALPLATYLGLLAALLSPALPGVATVLAKVAGLGATWIANTAQFLAGLPAARLAWWGGLGGSVSFIILLSGIAWLVYRRRQLQKVLRHLVLSGAANGAPTPGRRRSALTGGRRRRSLPARVLRILLVIALVIGVFWAWRWFTHPSLKSRTWQCDVGQGSAFVIETKPGHGVLVDTGPDGSGLGACLSQAGITNIDLLVLSHFHADHVGNLAEIWPQATVKQAVIGANLAPKANSRRVLKEFEKQRVPVTQLTKPGWYDAELSEIELRIYNPGAQDGTDATANDSSLAVFAQSGGASYAILGDLEAAGQEQLMQALTKASSGNSGEKISSSVKQVNKYPPVVAVDLVDGNPVDVVDVVVAAHHGAKIQNPQLFAQLEPRIVLVSVGKNNQYGHPHANALKVFKNAGAMVVRTDKCGAIALGEDSGNKLVQQSRC